MGRWIKLHDKLLNWQWHDDPAMVSAWIHMLLFAASEPRQWHGTTLGRGQFATTLAALSESLGLSVKQVRIVIDKLKKGKQIDVKGTNKFTIITICNYDSYQSTVATQGQTKGKQQGKQRANAITLEDIEDNISHTLSAGAHERTRTHVGWDIIDDALNNHSALLEQFCMQNYITRDKFVELASAVVTEWELTDPPHDDISDAKRHLFSTVRIKAKELKNNGNTDRQSYQEQRNDLYAGAAATVARLAAEDDARA